MTTGTRPPAAIAVPPEMRRLTELLHGGWLTHEHHARSPFAPEGGEGRGTEMIRLGPGGLSLVTEYASQNPMGVFRGLGVFSRAPDASDFLLHETVNAFPGIVQHRGRWEGERLVLRGSMHVMGQTLEQWHVFSDFQHSSFRDEISRSRAGERPQPVVAIEYQRLA